MSLYIGNLSEHSRRDELERVFRRFGHCNVQFKGEGYGFVVFDFPPDAEKALRALKGRNICGEPLTLTWSNKQPNTKFSRFARGGRSNYELQRARNPDRLGYAKTKVGFNGWRDHKVGFGRRGKSVEKPGEERGYHQDDFKDYAGEEKDCGGDFPDEGGGVVPNLEDSCKWDEPIHDALIDNGSENAIEFDRYEPYHGHQRKHDNGDHHVGYSGGSPAANSQEKMGRLQIGEETSNRHNGLKFQQACYSCGESGHKMRDCPREHSSRREYNRFDVVQNNKLDEKLKVEDESKFRTGPWVKLQSSGDGLPMRHHINERRVSGSQHYRASSRNESSPATKETGKEYGGKKRSRKEIASPKRQSKKMSRRTVSSPSPADYSASRSLSNSQSPKSLSRSSSHSRSRSVSSRTRSSSSKLRSSSKSQHRGGKSLNSRRASSPTSLSLSLNQSLPSSPKKIQLNSKSSTTNGTAHESRDHLVSQGQQQLGGTMELENLQSKDMDMAVNGKAAAFTTVADAMEKEQFGLEDKNDNHILLNTSDGVTKLSKPLVAGNLSPRMVKETEGFQHSGTLVIDDIPTDIQKPATETHANPHTGLSTAITTEEMCMVLNNSGLELPKDDEKSLTIDAFFGSARLWPWHIVYYRRLKKGPISIENYARRVAQNQEFGIVDKYIRSSSGWGEFRLENS